MVPLLGQAAKADLSDLSGENFADSALLATLIGLWTKERGNMDGEHSEHVASSTSRYPSTQFAPVNTDCSDCSSLYK